MAADVLRNGNVKWFVGLLVAIILGAGGWVYGAVQSVRGNEMDEIKLQTKTNTQLVAINDKRLALVEASISRMEQQNEQIIGKLDRLAVAVNEVRRDTR